MATFFDPKLTEKLTRVPYSVCEFVGRHRKQGCSEGEADIFHTLLENEAGALDLDIPSAGVFGPLVIRWEGDRIDLSKQDGFLGLPHWVESDFLKFTRCSARGILYCEHGTVASKIRESEIWQELKLLLVSGGGVPAVHTRRFLYLLQKRFGLPVYVLADNDTWGYFIFSVLRRGSVLPHQELPHLKLDDVRFLGGRAGEVDRKCLIRWESTWDARLRSLRRYPCFRSKAWQIEFDAFRRQRGKWEMAVLGNALGNPAFALDYLGGKIARRDWLS